MTRTVTLTTLGLLATMAASSLAPALADGRRDRQQTDKNNARNVAIAGAAVAVYGLLNHNSAATVLGAAGAALGGSQYEKDRKQQSQDNNGRGYYRSGYNDNGGNRGEYTSRNDNGDRYDDRDRNGNNADRNRDTSGWSQGRGRAWDARSSSGDSQQCHTGDKGSPQYRGSRNGATNRDTRTGNSNRDSDQDTDARWNGDSRTHDR